MGILVGVTNINLITSTMTRRSEEALGHTPMLQMSWNDVNGEIKGVLELTNQKNLDYALQEYGPYVDVLDVTKSKYTLKDLSALKDFSNLKKVVGLKECILLDSSK